MSNHELEDLLGDDCQRYQLLLESRLVDEMALGDADAAFMLTHSKVCDECSFYSSMLDTASVFDEGDGADNVMAMRHLVGQSFASRRSRRLRIAAVALAASVLAAVGVLFVVLLDRADGAKFDVAYGTISSAGKLVRTGAHFHLGKTVASPMQNDALIQIPKALFMAVERGAEIRLLKSTNRRLVIALDRGRLAVHLIPDGPVDLTVVLPNGEVEVVGTVFVVDANADGSQVEVVRGAVSVKPKKKGAVSRRLAAGFAYYMTDENTHQRTPRKDPLLELLGIREREDTAQMARAQRAGGTMADDGIVVDDIKNRRVDDRTGRARGGSRPSLESLLQAARECRMAKDWMCAVSKYRKVISSYPSRPEAATSMVSAAQILLDKLSSPADALTFFRRYQRRTPGGGLGREALFGECTALKALRRVSQERKCLEKYLEKYPGTLYSKMAKSRLTSIDGN